MHLDPTDGEVRIQIRECCEFIRTQCIRRNTCLDKPFEDYPDDVMYKLIKNVTFELQRQYGNWWDQGLTQDIIHAICLDKVRNSKAKGRPKKSKAVSETTEDAELSLLSHKFPPSSKRKKSRPTAELEESDVDGEQAISQQGPPGTTHRRLLPPPIDTDLAEAAPTSGVYDPVTPTNPPKVSTKGQSRVQQHSEQWQASPPDTIASVDPPTSPLMGSNPPGNTGLRSSAASKQPSALEDISTPGSNITDSFFDGVPESQYPHDYVPGMQFDDPDVGEVPETPPIHIGPDSMLPITQASQFRADEPTITVFIKGFPPLYIPFTATYENFKAEVAKHLKWGEDKFLLYWAKDRTKADKAWKTVGRDRDWEQLIKK